MNSGIQIIPIGGIGEIPQGSDLGLILFQGLQAQGLSLLTSDILVITQKIVSKSEGRIVNLSDIQPSEFAKSFAQQYQKDAAHIEVVLRESKRIVRMDHGVLITETPHGFVCANSGVDESNVGSSHTLTLLPLDPDRSARELRARLQQLSAEKSDIAIIISDTWGRPWREGQVNNAIGVAGMEALADYRGQVDPYGYEMHVSKIAVADELASAAELVMGKIDRVPAALIRGYRYLPGESSGQSLLRDSSTDMFR
jgi:coenzyme F420-0:L-glutamate ligase/coenzyme F420-1:gamma-L-glutamate ligase